MSEKITKVSEIPGILANTVVPRACLDWLVQGEVTQTAIQDVHSGLFLHTAQVVHPGYPQVDARDVAEFYVK